MTDIFKPSNLTELSDTRHPENSKIGTNVSSPPVKVRLIEMTELEKEFIEKMRKLNEEDFTRALHLLEFLIECRENSFAAPERDAEIG